MRRERAPRARLVGLGLLTGSLWILGQGAVFAAAPRNPEAEIERLKVRVVELEREATVGRVETARLRTELTRLEAELDEARKLLEAARRQGPETVAEAEPTGPIVETGPDIEEAPLEDEMLVGVAVAEPLSAPAEPPVSEAQP
ncbi:MAG: hypothetical protein HC897_11500, partial [Thermoanaerobaculia bacterium]|nr:hypothetical protein [Thermoanaerobaculia bacterium]